MMPEPKSRPVVAGAAAASRAHDRLPPDVLTPWAATGRLTPQERRLFEAALAADPALADDLADAHAERAAVAALGEAPGRPSARPLLALFAAIDAEQELGPNVTRLKFDRPRVVPQADPKVKKFSLRR